MKESCGTLRRATHRSRHSGRYFAEPSERGRKRGKNRPLQRPLSRRWAIESPPGIKTSLWVIFARLPFRKWLSLCERSWFGAAPLRVCNSVSACSHKLSISISGSVLVFDRLICGGLGKNRARHRRFERPTLICATSHNLVFASKREMAEVRLTVIRVHTNPGTREFVSSPARRTQRVV